MLDKRLSLVNSIFIFCFLSDYKCTNFEREKHPDAVHPPQFCSELTYYSNETITLCKSGNIHHNFLPTR